MFIVVVMPLIEVNLFINAEWLFSGDRVRWVEKNGLLGP